MDKDIKELYMRRCLQLAGNGGGYVQPNPMVGAVLVCDGKIIGEGYHRKYGEAHAEPNAIRSVKDPELLKRSTLYVSLEPCSHYGKTPPCANLIVDSQIPRVIIGTLDPNPKVSGRGLKILQQAGVEVEYGVLQDECRMLNRRFFVFQEEKRCYVMLKWAQTSDGFIDVLRTDKSQPPLHISNVFTGMLTHKMRSLNQAILVSTNTVLLDNPSLTVRNWTGKNPIRVAIDRQGRIPDDYVIKNQMVPTIIFTSFEKNSQKNLEFIKVDFDDQCLSTILRVLYQRNISSVLVEGGASLLNSFLNSGLWDEANVEVSDIVVSEGVPAPKLSGKLVAAKEYDKHQWLSFVRE